MRPNGLPPTHSEGRGGEQGKTAHPNTHRHVATRPQGPEQAALLKRLGGGAGSGSRRLGPSLLAPVWERPTDTLLLGPEGGQGSRRSSGKRPAAWSQGAAVRARSTQPFSTELGVNSNAEDGCHSASWGWCQVEGVSPACNGGK